METITRHLEDLLAFHFTASERSFTRAAEKLGSSKAMISKQIKRLEGQLRSQLFHRTTRSLRLTESGEALHSYSRKIFELSNEAGRKIRDMTEEDGGVVRITSSVSMGNAFFPSFIEEISALLPRTKFDLDLSNEVLDFKRDRVDFAIRSTEEHDGEVVARYLGHIRDVICVSPKLLKKIGPITEPKQLSGKDCIMNCHQKTWNTWELSSSAGEIQIEVTGRHATNQYTNARALCLQGLAIARMPYYIAAEDLRNGSLVQILEDYKIATHPLYLVYLKTEYTTKKHRLIKEKILEWFAERREMFV